MTRMITRLKQSITLTAKKMQKRINSSLIEIYKTLYPTEVSIHTFVDSLPPKLLEEHRASVTRRVTTEEVLKRLRLHL